MKLVVLAFRNLLRNPRRTLITSLAVAGGLGLMVFAINLAAGQYQTMLKNGISTLAGHVVVQAPGWQAERKAELLVPDAEAIAAELRAAYPEQIVTTRLWVDGLLTSPTSSAGVAITGVDPAAEALVSRLDDQIVEGTWLTGGDKGLLVGAVLAKTLGVGIGDKIVYMGQHGGGDMVSRLFRVEGIFRTGASDIDGFVAYATVAGTRELVGGGPVAHQVALHLEDPDLSDAARARVRTLLEDRPVEVLGWREAIPEVNGFIQVDRRSNDVIMSMLGVIVAIGVLNTVLMSVMERVREFGVLMAIGMRPGRVATMVLLEGLLLGLIGVAAGVVVGCVASYPLVTDGFDMTKFTGGETFTMSGVAMDTIMYADWDPVRIGKYAVAGVLLTVLAAAWPAWRVTHFQPIEALHHH